jgi:hypothetical protein
MNHNELFSRSVQLMLEIADLELYGIGESSQANALEDEAERYWTLLSDAEQLLIRAISADMWFLSGTKLRGRAPRDGEAEALAVAKSSGNWLQVASLLHESPALSSGVDGVALRAELWSALGQPKVARRFYDRLEQHNPRARLAIAARRIGSRQGTLLIPPKPHKCPFPLLHGPQRAA